MSKKKRGKIRASVSEAGVVETVPYPLLLEPKGKAQYFVVCLTCLNFLSPCVVEWGRQEGMVLGIRYKLVR